MGVEPLSANSLRRDPAGSALSAATFRLAMVLFGVAAFVFGTAILGFGPAELGGFPLARGFSSVASAAAGEPQEIVIGALLDGSGPRRTGDARKEAALRLGEQDVNELLAALDAPFRIKIIFEDTGSDPGVALQKMTELHRMGVRVFIGPNTSAEVEHIKPFADQRRLLVISPKSTATSLAIPRDSIYRFVMDDSHQAEALAHFIRAEGIRVVVPFARQDVYGDDLLLNLASHFSALGGTVLGGGGGRSDFDNFWVESSPTQSPGSGFAGIPGFDDPDATADLYAEVRYHPATTNFTGDLERLAAVVNRQIWDHGANSVAVQAVSFGEITDIMTAAERWPVLATVRWFGTDGTALNEEILLNPKAAAFAAKTGYVTPALGRVAHASDEFTALNRRVQQASLELTTTSAGAYDALWVAAFAHFLAGTDATPEQLYRAFEEAARWHFGASGWTALNEAGDRKLGSYDFWTVEGKGRSHQWSVVGEYQFIPGMPPRLVRR